MLWAHLSDIQALLRSRAATTCSTASEDVRSSGLATRMASLWSHAQAVADAASFPVESPFQPARPTFRLPDLLLISPGTSDNHGNILRPLKTCQALQPAVRWLLNAELPRVAVVIHDETVHNSKAHHWGTDQLIAIACPQAHDEISSWLLLSPSRHRLGGTSLRANRQKHPNMRGKTTSFDLSCADADYLQRKCMDEKALKALKCKSIDDYDCFCAHAGWEFKKVTQSCIINSCGFEVAKSLSSKADELCDCVKKAAKDEL